MSNPLVSIIIPVYNSQLHLRSCIESALAQTWQNTELIVVDDGSNDQSSSIAESFHDKKIKILRQPNRGASAARNRGLEVAKGDYIQFLDADDLLSPNKIEEQLRELKHYPNYVSMCATIHFKDGMNPNEMVPSHEWFAEGSENTIDFLIKLYGGPVIGPKYGGMVQPNAWLVPRTVIDAAGPWNENLSMDDDGEYFCRVLLVAKGIRYVKTAINYYRQHEKSTNLSAQLSAKGYESMLNATNLKYEHLIGKVDIELLNKIFQSHYQQIATATYPTFKDISNRAISKARNIGIKKIRYLAGPISTFLANLLGWKLVRLVNHWRFK